jgi:hypothetical protein
MLAPEIHLERYGNTDKLRLQEPREILPPNELTPLPPASDDPRAAYVLGDGLYDLANIYERQRQHLAILQDGAFVEAYNVYFDGIHKPKIHGGVFRMDAGFQGSLYVRRAYADGKQPPLNTTQTGYKETNVDFINAQTGTDDAALIAVSEAEITGFSDAIIDAKTDTLVSNVTVSDAYRLFRAQARQTVFVENADMRLGRGAAYAWLKDETSRIVFYNCLFDGEAHPDTAALQTDAKDKSIISRNIEIVRSRPAALANDSFFDRCFVDAEIEICDARDGSFGPWRAGPSLLQGPAGLPCGDLTILTPVFDPLVPVRVRARWVDLEGNVGPWAAIEYTPDAEGRVDWRAGEPVDRGETVDPDADVWAALAAAEAGNAATSAALAALRRALVG